MRHNVEFKRIAVSLCDNSSGCNECHKELTRQITGLTSEQYVKTLHDIFPYVDLLGEYTNLQTETEFYCNRCHSMWTDKPILVRGRGCPMCEHNSTENLVGKILDSYNIRYQRQYAFDDCVDKRKLLFDYFLIDYHILCEYDGEQHYHPVGFGCKNEREAYEKFLYVQRHDQIKNQYCEEHNIPLLRIPYWERKNISAYLINELIKIGVQINHND